MNINIVIDCATIMSMLTFLSTLYIAKQQYNLNKSMGSKQLDGIFFNKTFFDHLTNGLPRAREMLRFDIVTHQLKDTDQLIGELNAIRRESFYFTYLNEKFYKELMNALQEFEDYLVMNTDKTYYDKEMQGECDKAIKNYMNKIYSIIHNEYSIHN